MIAVATPSSSRYRKRLVALLTATYVVCYLDRQILGILIEPIKLELKLSDTQLGFLSGTAFALTYVLFGLLMGALADSRSRRAILGASLIVWSGATVLCGAAQNFTQLFLARVVVGIGEAGCVPAAQSLIAAHYAPAERGRALGIFMSGSSIGTFLGFLLGGLLAAAIGWRIAFVLAGVPGLILALLVLGMVREPPRPASDAAPPLLGQSLRAGLRVLRTRAAFRRVAISAGLGAMISYGLGTWLASFFIRYHGLSTAQAGVLLAVAFGLVGMFGIVAGGWLGDRAARRDARGYAWVAAAGLAVATPCYWLAFAATDLTLAIAALVPAVAASHAISAPAFAIVHGVVSDDTRGTGVALFMFVGNVLGIGLGALAIGALSDAFAGAAGENALRYSLLAIVSIGWVAAAGFLATAPAVSREWRAKQA